MEGCLYPSRYILVTEILRRLPSIKSLDHQSSTPLLSIFCNAILSNVSTICSPTIADSFKIRLTLKILKDRSLIEDVENIYNILTNEIQADTDLITVKNIITDELVEHCKDTNFTPFLPYWQNKQDAFQIFYSSLIYHFINSFLNLVLFLQLKIDIPATIFDMITITKF